MSKLRFLIVAGLFFGLATYGHAVCVNNADPCERPGFPASNNLNPPTDWDFFTTRVQDLKALVSATATGNPQDSWYYFAATNVDRGATTAKGTITNSSDGTTEISAPLTNGSSVPTEPVNGGSISMLRGGTLFFFYAQACPNGAAENADGCSAWTRIRTAGFSTNNYPTAPFNQPPAGGDFLETDSETNSITVRTQVPDGDPVSQIVLTIFDMDNALSDGHSQGFSGNNINYVMGNVAYAPGFRPNTRYRYTGRVNYEYGIAVPATAQDVQIFYTRPVDPVPGNISNVTHCSAQLAFSNSNGLPANPSASVYQVCLDHNAGCQEVAIGGNLPGSTNSVSFTTLVPGTQYSADVKVLNRGPSPWRPSETIDYPDNPDLTTGGTTGNFTLANITTTSADFKFPVPYDVTGATKWVRLLNGVPYGAEVIGLPPTTIAFTGLTPNTQYTLQIRVYEALCNYTVPQTALQLTTLAAVPQSFNLDAVSNNELRAEWATNGNASGTIYQVQYCTDEFFTQNCLFANSTAGATSIDPITAGVNPQTTYWAHVRALLVTGGVTSLYSNPDSATTSNEGPNITAATCSTPGGFPITSNCGGTVSDNGPVSEMRCSWSLVSGPGTASFNPSTPQTATGGGTCPSVVATFTNSGGYVLRLTVTDGNGTGLTDTQNVNVTVNASGPVFVTPPNLTMNSDNRSGEVSALASDNDYAESTLIYTWTVEGTGAPIQVTPNGTNAAKNAHVEFSAAGTYVLRCTVRNPNSQSSFAVTPARLLPQILTSIVVTPANVTINRGELRNFSAGGLDQFNNGMPLPSVDWTADSGSMNAGTYNSSVIGTNIRITATSGPISGSTFVNIVDFDVSGAKAYPVPYKSTTGGGTIHFTGLGSSAKIRIYTVSGREVFSVESNDPLGNYDWNVKNKSGESVASGVYLFVIESPTTKKNGKLIIIQ